MNEDPIMISPETYSSAAVIARESALELLGRLDLMTIKPELVLDVGCGVGESCELLQKKYGDANIIGIDQSAEMLVHARNLYPHIRFLQSEAHALPFMTNSVDLLFANFLLPWVDMESVLHEWKRVLKPNGLLIFSSLGPDTLLEWSDVLEEYALISKMDMHDIGDALLQLFSDPVLDVSFFTATYSSHKTFLHELIASEILKQDAIKCLSTLTQNHFEANYEVIFAHAFGQEHQDYQVQPVTKIPLSKLREKLSSL